MISVIIPTFNERAAIKETIRRLWERDKAGLLHQVIVSDGGSTDGTVAEAVDEGAEVIQSKVKGRAAQMNHGARQATGDVLYFLHADTIPPIGYTEDILGAVRKGATAGCFRLSFDYPHWFLNANCWFTRFDIDAVRFGDQSLFVTKEAFENAGGFCEKHVVLEDQELVKRLKKKGRFVVMNKSVTTSARKYRENGIYKTQAIFFLIYGMYRAGYSQQQLVATYRKLIRQDKI
jgi:rSAM/selenodomain-associated transferase 2